MLEQAVEKETDGMKVILKSTYPDLAHRHRWARQVQHPARSRSQVSLQQQLNSTQRLFHGRTHLCRCNTRTSLLMP